MNTPNAPLLDAALSVFLRYGFKRTTMGDIAKAAHMSRPSLYARYANKDDVYAAVLERYIRQTLSDLQQAWTSCSTLSEQLDCIYDVTVGPSFQLLSDFPDAADLIDGMETPAGKQAKANITADVIGVFSDLLAPFAPQLMQHDQTPQQVARFIEQSKTAMLHTATDQADLKQQFSTLKAALLALTR